MPAGHAERPVEGRVVGLHGLGARAEEPRQAFGQAEWGHVKPDPEGLAKIDSDDEANGGDHALPRRRRELLAVEHDMVRHEEEELDDPHGSIGHR